MSPRRPVGDSVGTPGRPGPRTALVVAWTVALWTFALTLMTAVPGLGAGAALAQQGGRTAEAAADTVDAFQAARDSARARQMRLLQDLSRTPGADSARLAADSARAAGPQRLEGNRAPVVSTSGDSILARLVQLEGYTVTEYSGVAAEYDAGDGLLVLRGDSVTRAAFRGPDGTRTSSDSLITYDQESGRMQTWGQVLSSPPGGSEVQSRFLECDVETEICRAAQARTQYSEGADWYVTSDLPLIASDVSYGHGAMFTSCELEEPHYHFAADNLKVVRGNILVAAPVRLYFADVPVAWLPFIAQSLSQGRSSGILTPTFSVNDIVRTSGGYRRRVSNVGFYWAMSDYMDSMVALDWFDDNYTAITGSYRFRWLRQFLQGAVNFRQFWRAEGGSELTLDSSASWDLSERTSFRASLQYATSSEFVTQNSFNPLEVTQSIDSQGGFNHRFDWGTLAVNGNRRQFLNDDRVETTFPSASLSLSTVTLFPAPRARASYFNNMTLSGGARFSASSSDFSQALGYIPGQEDRKNLSGAVNSSLNITNLSLSGSLNYRSATTLAVQDVLLDTLASVTMADRVAREGIGAFFTPLGGQTTGTPLPDSILGPPRDLARETLDWSTSINYQQNLIGSTTLTPRVSFSGNYLRADGDSLAADSFVAGPTRTSFGATLRTDLYGFFPGFAGFERIRHKVSPSFTYDWSPEVQPTPLQTAVFGSRSVQPRNVISVTLNQTFEAKRGTEEDSLAAPEGPASASSSGEPRRLPRSEIVNILSLRTSAVRYDFVEAEDFGFLNGFETVQLTNQISSDLLRGLSVNMTHSLFQDELPQDGGADARPQRTFDPQLTQLNLGFSLNNRSGIFRFLGFGGGDNETGEEEEEEEDLLGADDPFAEEDPLSFRRTDESSMIPTDRSPVADAGPRRSDGSGIGNWSAQISYALSRPRQNPGAPDVQSQMIQASLRLQPTSLWELSWRTSYDLEEGGFNDHAIRLSRDLHRWRANFDFLQTATGNWSFRFEVSLIDNSDLKFDYNQRSDIQRLTR